MSDEKLWRWVRLRDDAPEMTCPLSDCGKPMTADQSLVVIDLSARGGPSQVVLHPLCAARVSAARFARRD